MSPSEILLEARDRLNNTGAVILTPTKLSRAFNSAMEMWATDTECLVGPALTNLVAGQQEYNRIGGALERVFKVEKVTVLDATGELEREIPFRDYDDLPDTFRGDPSGRPEVWSVRGVEAYVLYPKPTSSITDGLLFYGVLLPETLSGDLTADTSTVLPYPREHREGLVRAVALKAIELDLENPNMAARHPVFLQSYNEEKAWATRFSKSPLARPIVMGSRGRTRRSTPRLQDQYGVYNNRSRW